VDATYQSETPTNPEAGHDDSDTTTTGSNRREHVRVTPNEHNGLAATLSSGSQIRLIDLSKGGAQFECERRFLPNASVSLRLKTHDGEVQVTGRVVRSRIVRLASGGLGYLVGLAFASTLPTELGVEPAAAPGVESTKAPLPAGTPEGAATEDPLAGSAAWAAPPVDLATREPTAAPQPTERAADISAEEALAFEATLEAAPAMLTVTATVDTTSDELQDVFNGNDW
jgi:hypothetical protein